MAHAPSKPPMIIAFLMYLFTGLILILFLIALFLALTDNADQNINQYRQTEGFLLFCEYTFAEDYGTSSERLRQIEAWARDQNPDNIDAINVRAWVRGLQARPKVLQPKYAKKKGT